MLVNVSCILNMYIYSWFDFWVLSKIKEQHFNYYQITTEICVPLVVYVAVVVNAAWITTIDESMKTHRASNKCPKDVQ